MQEHDIHEAVNRGHCRVGAGADINVNRKRHDNQVVDDSSAEDDEADHAAVERLGGGAALILDPRMLQGLIGSQA